MNEPKKSFVQELCSTVWWLMLMRGIFVGLFGLLLVISPHQTILILITFFGAYLFIDGIFTLINALHGRKVYKDWGWKVFIGILYILAGIIVFLRPAASALFTQMLVVYILAFVTLFNGISRIVAGFNLRKEIKGEWALIVSGLLAVIFSVLLFMHPVIAAMALVLIIGCFAIVGGLLQIILSFRIRKLGKQAV